LADPGQPPKFIDKSCNGRREIWHARSLLQSGPISASALPPTGHVKTPQALTLDAIPPIDKHGGMVQETAVKAQLTALARPGGGVRPFNHPRAEPRDRRAAARFVDLEAGVSEFDRPNDHSSNSNRHSSRVECDATRRKQKTAAHSTRHARRRAAYESRCKNHCAVFVDRNCFIAYTLRLSLQGKVSLD
jgi:hypothetical protein